nr:hypothetical protein Iba_scaffold3173CG0010 [Ipomoea batatas]
MPCKLITAAEAATTGSTLARPFLPPVITARKKPQPASNAPGLDPITPPLLLAGKSVPLYPVHRNVTRQLQE